MFSSNFTSHVKLEDEVFYIELVKDMKERGTDTSNTEKFISEMRDIENIVIGFMDKYKDEGAIREHILDFYDEFIHIKSSFQIRIESEEAGVYSYWGVF